MSSSPENTPLKQPVRHLEIQINNFNVAIPHHVDLLKRHKANIQKYEAQHEWEKIRREHINVSRIIQQLKELLYQLDTLRAHVVDSDINQFDKLTANAQTNIMNTIKEYMELELNLPLSQPQSSKDEDQSKSDPLQNKYVQLQEKQRDLQHQEACLHAWNTLQGDIHQLHQLYVDFNKLVDDQKELVNTAEDDIEESNINVDQGEKFLKKASRYNVALYPLTGAVLGTCIGGPIGLIAGLKIGGLTALGCGILGFAGASLLKKKKIDMQKSTTVPEYELTGQQTAQKSTSLPENLSETKKEL
ncbi:PREDICTED: syntaxin-17 isoform X2 [Eufriesea mexicana]|uniref:syntaxin-17 isoform X2 n=1 Tax=Eufriesea mexicana TaxID=516756 RepID=UPI00083C698F|nr:PREDICTED: syntaxin-17 isoform X2 [Eufriesea mexicana]XP_017753474.1 PREDICTED: syntaxin-17 isoform X2 [Eufriesea mexicana]XP_017753475.1 PREDICTED: syntaxin-17 isoform X2 [Eufriesea mexicana]